MTESEILEFLEGRSPLQKSRCPTLAFDTNAIFGARGGLDLIDTINLVNEHRGKAPRIFMVIPALVLHEKLRHMAQAHGDKFDPQMPLSVIRSKNLVVKGFGLPHAVQTASRIQELFPSMASFGDYKKRRCLQCLGLPESTSTSGNGNKCGASVDWLIAGQVELRGYLLVTSDTGSDMSNVRLSVQPAQCLSAAKRLLAGRRQPS